MNVVHHVIIKLCLSEFVLIYLLVSMMAVLGGGRKLHGPTVVCWWCRSLMFRILELSSMWYPGK